MNKCGGSNKACMGENFLKKNKICCILIRELRVHTKKTVYELNMSKKTSALKVFSVMDHGLKKISCSKYSYKVYNNPGV